KGRSLGAAAFLAAACDEIVMGTGSAVADFNYLAGEKADALRTRRDMLLPLVKEQGYPPALFEAALTRNLALVRVKTSGGDLRLVTEPAFKENQESGSAKWDALGRLTPGHDESFLRVGDDLAREWRVTRETGVDTVEALYSYY